MFIALIIPCRPWKSGNPDNYLQNEHCGEFSNAELNDVDCNSKINFICEKPKCEFKVHIGFVIFFPIYLSVNLQWLFWGTQHRKPWLAIFFKKPFSVLVWTNPNTAATQAPPNSQTTTPSASTTSGGGGSGSSGSTVLAPTKPTTLKPSTSESSV